MSKEISRESRRWLEDTLSVGRTVNPFIFQDEHGVKVLRCFTNESKLFNEVCLNGLEQMGCEYARLSDKLESKLCFLFGSSAFKSAFDESNLPELEWLLSISMTSDAETTDNDKLQLALKHLIEDISSKQRILSEMKNNYDNFKKMESELGEMKSNLERASRKIEVSMEAQKAKMSENANSLNKLARKRKQYQKASAKLEQDLLRRNINSSFSSSSLFEHQDRIVQLSERAATLEDALRHYCGLPTDKREAEKKLNELAVELSKIDMKLIEKIRDQ